MSGTSQTINIKVIESSSNLPLDGCSCIVIDGSNSQQALTSNPAVIKVSKQQGGVHITCTKKGYTQLNTSVGDSFNNTSLVNILFWPGFIVDGLTGAYKKIPSFYVVSMKKN
jgi:hypothetical protein